MRHRTALPGLAVIVAAFAAGAQTRPTFEVVSVKANTSADFRGAQMQFLPGGRFVATNYPLQFVIAAAWNVPFQGPRLAGGPEWVRSERFDIEAKAAKGPVPHAEMRLMLQALLEDRFHLKMRRDTKELPIFAVIVGKNGPKLEKSTIEEKDCETAPCHVFMGGRGRGLHGQA